MMKKLSVILSVVLLVVSLGACSKSAPPSSDQSEVASSEVASTEVTSAELRTLFDENLFCILNVYEINFLPHEDEPYKDDRYYRVTDERFKTVADLETYTKKVYVEAEANRLLYEPRLDDDTLYLDIDGHLCIDSHLMGGKGYYVNWEAYTLTVDSISDAECTFTVTAAITEPAENPVAEPYSKTGKAIKRDGKWLLEKMIY